MLRDRDIDFNAADRQVMCYAHVVNLSSGRVIDAASRVGADNDDDDDDDNEDGSGPPPNPQEQSYDDAVARDPIALGRNVVRIIHASGEHRQAFDEVIEDGNRKGWFVVGERSEPIKVKKKELLQDVRTRWDSVYHMLNRLREMRPVCFSHCNQSHIINRSILTGYRSHARAPQPQRSC